MCLVLQIFDATLRLSERDLFCVNWSVSAMKLQHLRWTPMAALLPIFWMKLSKRFLVLAKRVRGCDKVFRAWTNWLFNSWTELRRCRKTLTTSLVFRLVFLTSIEWPPACKLVIWLFLLLDLPWGKLLWRSISQSMSHCKKICQSLCFQWRWVHLNWQFVSWAPSGELTKAVYELANSLMMNGLVYQMP